jgi:hypothetical protein
MAKYKTALGRTIDMAALAAKNEKTRAVGNMKVNARGDSIDSLGRVTQSVTTKVNSGYAKSVGNRAAKATSQQRAAADPIAKVEEIVEFSPEQPATLAEDVAIEEIKAKEVAATATTPAPVSGKSKTKEAKK